MFHWTIYNFKYLNMLCVDLHLYSGCGAKHGAWLKYLNIWQFEVEQLHDFLILTFPFGNLFLYDRTWKGQSTQKENLGSCKIRISPSLLQMELLIFCLINYLLVFFSRSCKLRSKISFRNSVKNAGASYCRDNLGPNFGSADD